MGFFFRKINLNKKDYKLFSIQIKEVKMSFFRKKKKWGQVWVETVVYTLIAFAMIGLVLSFARPKIEESKDKAVIEQSIQIMEEIDAEVQLIRDVPGNKRLITLYLKQGELIFDGEKDLMFFELESEYQYSESGEIIEQGDLEVQTLDKGKFNDINITRNYNEDLIDVKYNGQDIQKIISSATTAYKIYITNEGIDTISDKTIINFEIE